MTFMADYWVEGPTSDDKKEQKKLDRLVVQSREVGPTGGQTATSGGSDAWRVGRFGADRL